ncbi:MAG: Bsp6I family type II restriction endonuclease [Acholeplasmatales bacterium]|nr:Bsp6I family type II restriction endonuclease [Acholeplasmatales bacterium]
MHFFNEIRTNGTADSYDCVSLDTFAGIQVKFASIPNDCTSFGPNSTWDELYYVDFAPNGYVDGKVVFYKIDVDFSDLVLNAKKSETFHDQQMQGRRPRFSIKNQLIKAYNINPYLLFLIA